MHANPANTVPSRRHGRRRFTLVELLAAAALIAIVGGIMVRMYANLHRAYGDSLRLASLGQDARSVFSLITRDLRLATTREDDVPGQDIRVHQPANDELWFVSANESGSGGASLIEVGYRLNGTTLERAEVNDASAGWNPYGNRDDASTQGGFQPVVDRVVGFRVRCYDRLLAGVVPNQSTGLPAMVGIEITMLDPKSFARWEQLGILQRISYARDKGRTFQKTIQIPAAQYVD